MVAWVSAMCWKLCSNALFLIASDDMLLYVCSSYCAVSWLALLGGLNTGKHTIIFSAAKWFQSLVWCGVIEICGVELSISVWP